MNPSNDPIGNLARALNSPKSSVGRRRNFAIQVAVAEATLRLGGRFDRNRSPERMPDNENLLVVADQFEEIFRFAREAKSKAKGKRRVSYRER